MAGLDALGIWWGYAEGDPRVVGAVVVIVAAAAAVFMGRRAVALLRERALRERATTRGRR
jgi:hypothetical protein